MGLRSLVTMIDLEWSSDGDFVVRRGDISDTKEWTGKGFVQECEDRIKSEPYDWKLEIEKGAGLDSFRGENNSEEIRGIIERVIKTALTRGMFLHDSDITVSAAPLSPSEVVVRVDIDVSSVDAIVDSEIVIRIAYDLQGQGPFILR